MAKHISRHELKKDEIRETLEHGAEALASHQRQLWFYGIVVVLVVAAVLGWRFYSERQTTQASAAFADALKIYQARIRGVNDPAEPGEITYVDEKNKYADSAKKFADVAARFPRTRPGQEARYYAALSLIHTERYDDAQKDLATLMSGSDEGFKALATFQLAQIYEKTGKDAQAVQLYQQLIDKPSPFVPKPVSLLALADHYAKNNPAQAAKLYTEVKTEFPDTQAAQLADQRLQLLPAKS